MMKNNQQLGSASHSQSNDPKENMQFFNVSKDSPSKNIQESENCFAFIYAFTLEVAHTAHYNMQRKIAKLKNILAAQEYKEDPSVSINTKFFDNVIQSFGKTDKIITRKGEEKQSKKCYATCMRKDVGDSFRPHIFKKIVDDKKNIKHYSFQSDYCSFVWKSKINVSLSNVRVYIFDSGIGFVSLFFKMYSKSNINEKDIYYIYHSLQKDYNLKSVIKSFVENQLKDFKSVVRYSFLETQRNNQDNALNAFGSSVFFNLCLKTQSNILDSKIPGWILGKLPIVISSGQTDINKNLGSLVDGNLYGCTVQGCCVLTYIKTHDGKIERNIERYLDKNIVSICQHAFLEYIMVLHQTYFLHMFSEHLEHLNAYAIHSTQMIEIEDCNDDCSYFRSKYMYELAAISQNYQQMYVNFRTSMEILSSDEHITEILKVLHNVAERKADRIRSSILTVITISSLANVIINLLNLSNTLCWETILTFAVSVPIAVLLLLISVTPSISRFITHRIWRRIVEWFKRKRK